MDISTVIICTDIFCFLPHSPDLNPVEKMLSKLKVILRRLDGKVIFMLNTMFFSAFFVKYGK